MQQIRTLASVLCVYLHSPSSLLFSSCCCFFMLLCCCFFMLCTTDSVIVFLCYLSACWTNRCLTVLTFTSQFIHAAHHNWKKFNIHYRDNNNNNRCTVSIVTTAHIHTAHDHCVYKKFMFTMFVQCICKTGKPPTARETVQPAETQLPCWS